VKIHIILLPSNTKKTIDVKKNTSVTEILEKLQIKPDTVIVTKNNIPIPIDEKLDEAKELKIIQVASGG
jgi:sulfur carrier protein